ncbi:uncharacterized protein LOC111641193 [Centruroides sculpturatus]|uniref:uncharacterized protein LOC111641193 n=1 Tax=Centruroides sculpturatus TaxID=218467 RepID=UPI000C6E009C|nr:uncharacterized protein LOC111641193 [Centruroides sculpturatus]
MKILQFLHLCLLNSIISCHLDGNFVKVNVTREKFIYADLTHADNQIMNFDLSPTPSKSTESIQRQNDNSDKQKNSDNLYNKELRLKFFAVTSFVVLYLLSCQYVRRFHFDSEWQSSLMINNNNEIEYEMISGSHDENIWNRNEWSSDMFSSFHFSVEENGSINMIIKDDTKEELSNLLGEEEESETSRSDSLVVISMEDEFQELSNNGLI